MKFLIDECLHPTLVGVATARDYEAYFVGHYGLASTEDWDLMEVIVEQDFVFVTNNARDFRRLYKKQPLHAGLVIIVPQVSPADQRVIFEAVLDEIGGEDGLVNEALEVTVEEGEAVFQRYDWPDAPEAEGAAQG